MSPINGLKENGEPPMPDGAAEDGGFRKHRRGSGQFDIHDAEAFDLQPLSKLRFDLDAETIADLTVAENAIWDLNQRDTLRDREVYARAMLNIEAMASVRMDGKPPSAAEIFREAAEASFGRTEESDHLVRYGRDRESLRFALSLADSGCSVDTFKAVHEKVLPPKHAARGGLLRDDLKQVGGSRYHVFGSTYTMPAPERIEPLLADLADFMALDAMPVVEQAGIAHAQLINIHPFERGNGKMARMVIHTSLRYRGITPYYLLPFTPVVVTSSHDYIAGINSCKFDGSEDRKTVSVRMNQWLSYFSNCCLTAVEISAGFVNDCEALLRRQMEHLNLRRGSVAAGILRMLPEMPAFTVQMAADRLGASFKRASEACKQLEAAGVITLATEAKRNRIYQSPEVLEAYMAIDALR